MARKGRDLEKLVAFLERHLGPEGIQVKSPDYIKGKDSRSRREVDVALRSKIGSSELLVILECRDRAEVDDVKWIEQLATKREDVGADKAVAVSVSGFTSGAQNTAAATGIELRTMEEVDPHEFLLWFGFKEVTAYKPCSRLSHISVTLTRRAGDTTPSTEALGVAQQSLDFDAPTFRQKSDDRMVSLRYIWSRLPTRRLFAGVPMDGSQVERRIRIESSDEESRFQLVTPTWAVDVEYIEVHAMVWLKVERIPLATVRVYRDDQPTIAQTAVFAFEYMGAKHALELHLYPESGAQLVSLRTKEDPGS